MAQERVGVDALLRSTLRQYYTTQAVTTHSAAVICLTPIVKLTSLTCARS